MSSVVERLRHQIKLKFGCPPSGPTDMELAVVIRELDKIRAVRQLTLDDWTQVVHENVYEAGAYCYFSQDFSDLNALLDQVIQAQGARWRY